MKQLDINVYETDDGAVISRRERSYLTYLRDGREVRLPVETTVRMEGGKQKLGLSIGTEGTLHWSDGSVITADEIARVRSEIRSTLAEAGTECSFAT